MLQLKMNFLFENIITGIHFNNKKDNQKLKGKLRGN